MMNERIKNNLERLAEFLHFPKDELSLLQTAITHRSFSKENNERLEFLGDSILNFVIGAELFKILPEADEGTLTRIRAQLVRKETLVELAENWNLSEYVLLGPGERKTGGNQSGSILADTFEALLGCVFCIQGFPVIYDLILDIYQEKFANISSSLELKDPKTKLQELLQSKKLQLPEYTIKKILGAQHDQTFHVLCKVVLLPKSVLGIGPSRRKAEQAAAANMLEELCKKQKN